MRILPRKTICIGIVACVGCLLCMHGYLHMQEPAVPAVRHHQDLSATASIIYTWIRAASGDGKPPSSSSSSTSSSSQTGIATKDATNYHRHKTTPVQLKADIIGTTHSVCTNLHKPTNVQVTQTFQPVLEGKSWVFSAYYDARRPKHVVKIIGIAEIHQDSIPRFCRIWFNHTSKPEIRNVKEEIVPETHDRRFAVFIYTCHLEKNIVPYAVSLIRDGCDSPNTLPVVNNYKKSWSHSSRFTVCGPVLYDKYNNQFAFVEMVETNGLFGADHYVFYNYSTGADIHAYLRKYEEEGLVDVVQWPLPPELVDEQSQYGGVHYFGQLASLNDCLYRNLYKAKYIVFLDLDELLVPKSSKTWNAVISSLPNRPYAKCSAVFCNAFFRTDWPQPNMLGDREATIAQDFGVKSLTTTIREQTIWSHGMRSKYIADTNRLEMAGIHLPWQCIGERYNNDVSPSIALLHHYRNWSDKVPQDATKDDSVLLYKKAILQRIINRHQQFRSNS